MRRAQSWILSSFLRSDFVQKFQTTWQCVKLGKIANLYNLCNSVTQLEIYKTLSFVFVQGHKVLIKNFHILSYSYFQLVLMATVDVAIANEFK